MEAILQLTGDGEDGSSLPRPDSDKLADFMAAVRPFHRLVYLAAFAYTKDSAAAELVSVLAMAAAFPVWKRRRQSSDEFRLCLIRITVSEALAYLKRNASPLVENSCEEIGDLVIEAIIAWRQTPANVIGTDAVRSNLMTAIQELSAATTVTLLLRDAFHLTRRQISGLTGESRHKINARLAYGRVSLSMKLAKCVSGCDLPAQASLAAAY